MDDAYYIKRYWCAQRGRGDSSACGVTFTKRDYYFTGVYRSKEYYQLMQAYKGKTRIRSIEVDNANQTNKKNIENI